jgi:hypothetical protein
VLLVGDGAAKTRPTATPPGPAVLRSSPKMVTRHVEKHRLCAASWAIFSMVLRRNPTGAVALDCLVHSDHSLRGNVDSLDLAVICAETETAQRFLESAFDSVAAMFANLETLRQLRKQQGRNIQGRLPGNEADLLRAAVLFSGAGMDAALKRLIEDALAALLDVSSDVHEKLETFVVSRLNSDAATSSLARFLVSPAPRNAVIVDYISSLTGESLQSVEQVDRVAGALGLNDRALREEIKGLRGLFIARNEISHELDLQQTQRQGDRSRVTRKLRATEALAHSGLNVTQRIINGVAVTLTGS